MNYIYRKAVGTGFSVSGLMLLLLQTALLPLNQESEFYPTSYTQSG